MTTERYHFDDPPRCEADHKDGGVCRRVLAYPDWSCPGEAEHKRDIRQRLADEMDAMLSHRETGEI